MATPPAALRLLAIGTFPIAIAPDAIIRHHFGASGPIQRSPTHTAIHGQYPETPDLTMEMVFDQSREQAPVEQPERPRWCDASPLQGSILNRKEVNMI